MYIKQTNVQLPAQTGHKLNIKDAKNIDLLSAPVLKSNVIFHRILTKDPDNKNLYKMQKQFAIASLSLVILLTYRNLVAGQIERPGQCPNLKLVKNFVLKDYLGYWYVYEKYSVVFIVGGTRCLTDHYGELDTNRMTVAISQITADNKESTNNGTGVLVSSGKFSIDIPGPFGPVSEYLILETDYKSYSVMISCNQLDGKYQVLAWVLTRKRTPSKEVITMGEDALKAQGFPLEPLMVQDQKNC